MFDLNRVETLAAQFEEQGDLETAELLLSNVLDIKRRDEHARPAEIIELLHRLAVVCEKQDRHVEALRYAKQAYDIVRHKLGPADYDPSIDLAWIREVRFSVA